MDDTLKKAAVIGAGIAGLTLANALKEKGFDVTVFEKSRGPGGRTSTRRTDFGSFDHGAQYFSVTDDSFAREVEKWKSNGIITNWNPVISGEVTDDSEKYIATPSMNAICKYISNGLDVRYNSKVENASELLREYDFVALSTPPAQAVKLVDGVDDKAKEFASRVEMISSFAAMLSFNSDVSRDYDVLTQKDGAAAKIVLGHKKPKRDQFRSTIIIHSGNEWAKDNVDVEQEVLLKQMISEAEKKVGFNQDDIGFSAIHRWLYSEAKNPLKAGCYLSNNQNLALIGDWCEDGGIEGAFKSAQQLIRLM